MIFKYFFKILFIFISFNSNANEAVVIECIGMTKFGASNEKNIHSNLLKKTADTEILITLKEGLMTVNGAEFKELIPTYAKNDGDLYIIGFLKQKDTSYEGYYSIGGWLIGSDLYHYSRKSIQLDRLNGYFSYSWSFYNHEVKNNWLGRLTKTNLNKGYLHRFINGKCKKSAAKQLF